MITVELQWSLNSSVRVESLQAIARSSGNCSILYQWLFFHGASVTFQECL